MWDIIRSKPNGEHIGKAIPVFINNMQQHYAAIDVYSDGAIDVWGFLDLQLFEVKMKTGWVSVKPPNNSTLSIFSLGSATVAKGEWKRSLTEIRDQVLVVVEELNPTMKNLVDMAGSDTRKKGKGRYAKMGLSDDRPFRIDEAGKQIVGKDIPVFERDGRDYRLQHWFLFSDGSSRIGTDGYIVSFDDVCGRIENDDLLMSATDAEWIEIPTLGRFKPEEAHWHIQADQRILEAKDLLSTLQGNAGAIQVCVEAHNKYNENPIAKNLNDLRTAYVAVPDHLKRYCGDMDSKDWPIRRILKLDDY